MLTKISAACLCRSTPNAGEINYDCLVTLSPFHFTVMLSSDSTVIYLFNAALLNNLT